MTKHTRGPWTLERDSDSTTTGIGEPIAIVGGEETGERVRFTIGRRSDYGPHGDSQTEANARLIAAAPDLLTACEQIVNGWGHQDGVSKSVAMARAAIAKTKGEAAQ